MLTKRNLRETILSRIESKSASVLRKRSRVIQGKLFGSGIFKKARGLCIYVSLPAEVDTWPIIAKCLRSGKKVLAPLADPRTKQLKFYEIRNPKADLKKGAYGILEPKPAMTRLASFREADLVIVPGVAFDKRGHRLGRGAGYYDRFLEKIDKKVHTVGLAFSFQIVAKLPAEKHDQKLDRVITD